MIALTTCWLPPLANVIRFHQTFLSPISGPRSHFRPTSSRYMQLAMKRYGFVQGLLMGLDRLDTALCKDYLWGLIV